MKIPITYIAGAFFFGLIVAIGLSMMLYHPLPVQVQINQYAPIRAPAPAIPTIVQTPVPSGDKFAPAPAPVVVTTEPLPTIRAEPTPVGVCDPGLMGDGPENISLSLQCTTIPAMSVMVGLIPLLIILAVFQLIFSVFGSLLDPRG